MSEIDYCEGCRIVNPLNMSHRPTDAKGGMIRLCEFCRMMPEGTTKEQRIMFARMGNILLRAFKEALIERD